MPSDNAAAATPFVINGLMAPYVLPGLILSGPMTRLLSGVSFRELEGYRCFMDILQKHFARLGLIYSYWPAWFCSPVQYWRKGGVLTRSTSNKMEEEVQLSLTSAFAVNCFWQSSKTSVGSMTSYAAHGKVETGSAWGQILVAARARIEDASVIARRLLSDGMRHIAMLFQYLFFASGAEPDKP